MGLLILTIIFLAVGIGMLVYSHKRWDTDGIELIGGLLTILCTIGLLIELLMATMVESKFAYYESQYENLKEQLEYVDSDDIVTGDNLRNQVLDMNNAISKHKCYSQNWFIGMYYSEHVGSLEPLKWKSRTTQKNIIVNK